MESKIVISLYNDGFKENLDNRIVQKLEWDGIDKKDLEQITEPNYENLLKMAMNFSDGVIFGSESVNLALKKNAEQSGMPLLPYQAEENYIDAYSDFYDKILS